MVNGVSAHFSDLSRAGLCVANQQCSQDSFLDRSKAISGCQILSDSVAHREALQLLEPLPEKPGKSFTQVERLLGIE